jgi:hypothetical protein
MTILRTDIMTIFNQLAALQLCLRIEMCIPMPQPPAACFPYPGTRGGK